MTGTAKVAIIGGGPAGISCAIQLVRSGVEPILIEKDRIAGALRGANLVENYLGFPAGISGENLARLIEKQVERFDLNVVKDKVVRIDLRVGAFAIECETASYISERIVVATGAEPSFPEAIPNEAADRVFARIEDVPKIAGKRIAVVGAGDAAFDYALNLASRGAAVAVFNRSERIKAVPVIVRRAFESDKIEYFENRRFVSLGLKTKKLEIAFENLGDVLEKHSADYLIFAIGKKPNFNFLSEEIANEIDRLIESKKLFVIGDAANDIYRQVSIAAGDGVKAAMVILKDISEENK